MRARPTHLALALSLAAVLTAGCESRPDPATRAPAPSVTASVAATWTAPRAVAVTPILAGTRVLAVRHTPGQAPTLLGLDAATGTARWQTAIGDEHDDESHDGPDQSAEHPEHEAHTLQVIAHGPSNTGYAAWPTPENAMWTVTAFTLDTGKALWTRQDAPGVPLHATTTGVVVGTGFAASDIEVAEPTGTAVLSRPNGQTLWTLDGTAAAAVSGDTILAATGTTPLGLAGVEPSTGTTRWTYTDPTRTVITEAAHGDRALVSTRDENGVPRTVRVIDTRTGRQVGTDLALPENADVTARIDRDTQTGLLGDGATLHAIDLATGTVLWTRHTGPDPVSVAGGGLTWVISQSVVLDSRTGEPVPGVPVDTVTVAGPGLALSVGEDLHAIATPATR